MRLNILKIIQSVNVVNLKKKSKFRYLYLQHKWQIQQRT